MSFAFLAVIHEFAVIGTTFFLLAIATIWYSPTLFGTMLRGEDTTSSVLPDESSGTFWLQLSLVFGAFLFLTGLLAWLLAYILPLALTPLSLAMICSGFAIVANVAPVVFDGRPWRVYLVHTGFMVLSIALAIASLTYWPW